MEIQILDLMIQIEAKKFQMCDLKIQVRASKNSVWIWKIKFISFKIQIRISGFRLRVKDFD